MGLCLRCIFPEFWCPALSPARCSQFVKCLAISSSLTTGDALGQTDNFANSVNLTSFSATISKAAPVITLLGSGRISLLSTGGSVMFDNATYLSM